MQNIDSAERFNEFEQAVISVAEAQAKTIIEAAEQERKDMLHKAHHSVAVAEYDKLTFAAERWRFGTRATMRQASRRRLLAYRESLIDDLFAELDARLAAFTKTPAYEELIRLRLAKYEDAISQRSVLYCASQDIELYKKLLEGTLVKLTADEDIVIGGFSLECGHLLYDETLDTQRQSQREELLSYCDLRVV